MGPRTRQSGAEKGPRSRFGPHVELTYYADGSPATRTDQRGVVLTDLYDDLARLTADKATTVPTNDYFDPSIRRIDRGYDQRGRLAKITSFDNLDGADEHAKNQVAFAYSAWGPVETSWQAHGGLAVTTGTDQSPHAGQEKGSRAIYGLTWCGGGVRMGSWPGESEWLRDGWPTGDGAWVSWVADLLGLASTLRLVERPPKEARK